jgi:murein L,D-transpeptidase YcbB/YkuD
LQRALHALEGQQEKGGWQPVPVSALTPGRANPAIVALRRRLAASGELIGRAATSDSAMYDPDVVAAVKAFQEHHTLKANGVADAATILAMNVPIEHRIRQLALNLERWRWMPDDFGSRYLLVNIPSYHVVAREDGNDVMDIRVVVGKPGTETPVFSGEMTTVVFSPYWNIPDTIVEGETVPALARDRNYLDRNNIEILRVTKSGTEGVDPGDVDWGNENSLKTLMFRQKPGPGNALGHVKFLFPNEYDVYLHDTPADALFARTGRAFSHGCVRVEEPETLAKYVLRGDDDWNEPKILEAMNAGVEQAVKLKASIRVHIVYFTATVDQNGGLHLLNDVYGYDAKQSTNGAHQSQRPLQSH